MSFEKFLTFERDGRRFAAWETDKDIGINIDQDRALASIIHVPEDTIISAQWIKTRIEEWSTIDDVFSRDFLEWLFFETADDQPDLPQDAQEILQTWDTSYAFIKREKHRESKQGVYVFDHGHLREVMRLYDDTNNTYVSSMRRDGDGHLVPLGLSSSPFNQGCVAVHSRLRDDGGSPLQKIGARIAIKDQFDIKGFKTSVGSRSWRRLASEATKTAPAVQRLIEEGAQITGYTQMCAYHQYQEPTQCIDFQDPWNARGDGFQSPAGGSSGQAAAIGAYEWLDFAIGSDTTVSARMPAQSNGCFALRPTWGTVSNEGTWHSTPLLDISALFGRDITKFPDFIETWYGEQLSAAMEHKKIGYIYCIEESLALASKEQIKVLCTCVRELEFYLGATVKWISLQKMWAENPPEAAGKQSLAEYLGSEVRDHTWMYEDWNAAIGPFRDEYIKKFHEEPFWPPPNGIHRWDGAQGVTEKEHQAALQRINVYRHWVNDRVFNTENFIAVMPIRTVAPNYRDTWESPHGGNEKMWEPQMLSPVLGTPEIVVPASEFQYTSKITGNEEYLPICVSILGQRGSDKGLAQLIEKWLRQAGRATKVHAGRRMFCQT